MSFTCQRCNQPVRLDDSLSNLDQSSADMLIGPLSSEEEHEREAQKNRTLASSKQPPPPQALNTRVIGIKQQPSLSPSRSQYSSTHKRDSFPAPSESFVVLPHPESTQSTNTPTISSSSHQKRHSTNTAAATASDAASSTTAATATPYTLQAIHPMSTSTLIEDPNWTRNNTLSHRLKVANRVFDLMSSKSSVDHPMCQECLDILLELLNKRLTDVGRERDCYIEFLKKVKDSRVTPEEERELARQVEDLKLAEKEASAELEQLQQEEARLDHELRALDDDMQDLDRQQEIFWEKSNEYQLNLQQFQKERDSINLKYDHDVKQYERLQKTVVYNDAFCISHDGPFGTINGFRLGRLSTHQVDWSEINAAWGQTLLLLYTVASKLKFQFKTYRLVPMGSFSRIEKVDGDSVVSYELYGSGDFGINRMFFLNRRFDHAMVAVLNCLKQLTDYAEEKDNTLRLPYRITKDKIGELSIRIQFNQDETWTKALKYMLTNMKWILVFASRANISNESTASNNSNDSTTLV